MVRRSGGVYYTPSFVVERIVRDSLAPCLAGKRPETLGDLRILDPACGSGSFLLGAYQYMLDWYLDGYCRAPSRWSRGRNARILRLPQGGWRLSLARQR